MCSTLLQLSPRSRDLSQAEKKTIVMLCKAEQIHKMTLNFVLDEQSCHFVNLLSS